MEKIVLGDEHFMREAMKEAERAFREDEIPVGAVIVCNNMIIARAHNMTQLLNDVTAHAEMIAFTSASNHLNSKYLDECTLYVTLEPCLMCAGACYWAQIQRIVFGASDERMGYRRCRFPVLHPRTEMLAGILEKESSALLKKYFQSKRYKES